jgi:alcohol dehydrogenase
MKNYINRDSFTFFSPSRVIFSSDMESALKDAFSVLGPKKVMIVTDPYLAKMPNYANLIKGMKATGMPFEEYTDVHIPCTDIYVKECAQVLKKSDADLVIGFGGGSSLDTAKISCILKTNPGEIRDYYGMQKVPNRPLPMIAIPTTAGSGAETTQVMSITDTVQETKCQIGDYKAVADITILCPDSLAGTSWDVAAAAGFDALTHTIEAYTNSRATPYTQAISIKAFEMIYNNLYDFVKDPEDKELASNMIVGSNMAAICVSQNGTGTCHDFARPVGGHYHYPHGVCLAVLLPHVLDFNMDVRQEMYAQLARTAEIADAADSDAEAAHKLILAMQDMRDKLKIPNSFMEMGMTWEKGEHMDNVVRNAMKADREGITAYGAPKRYTEQDVIDVITKAYKGVRYK